jgi:hypothetical protein
MVQVDLHSSKGRADSHPAGAASAEDSTAVTRRRRTFFKGAIAILNKYPGLLPENFSSAFTLFA